jgi:hypothetical protein
MDKYRFKQLLESKIGDAKPLLTEIRTHTISKPTDYVKFQENCKIKDSGSFRTFVDGVHLRCTKEEGSFFQQPTVSGTTTKENPFKKTGVNGSWKLIGDKIELKTTL